MRTQKQPRIGGTTSPSVPELKAFAGLVLNNIGSSPVRYGINRLHRVTAQFHDRMPNGTFWAFFLHLSYSVCQLSDASRERLMADPEIGSFISYADPTGEQAVKNVLASQFHN